MHRRGSQLPPEVGGSIHSEETAQKCPKGNIGTFGLNEKKVFSTSDQPLPPLGRGGRGLSSWAVSSVVEVASTTCARRDQHCERHPAGGVEGRAMHKADVIG